MKTTLLFCVMLMAIDPSAYAEDKNTIEYLESRITENEKLMKQTFDEMRNEANTLKQRVDELEQELQDCKGLTIEERVEHLEELAKIKTLRSCYELAQHGVVTSGLYNIDPDGDQIGKPPIEVYCDFENQQTIIHHNSEGLIVAHHCEEVGCFEHVITYPAGNEQIEALTQISENCEQEIEFGCFLAPLTDDLGDEHGWWTDKNGKPQYFFTGDHIGEHICTCGLYNSCLNIAGVERKCNCDANIPDWSSDNGIITAKDILPIKSVVYGPLPFPIENANFTVGPLKCSGKRTEDPSTITCDSLKRSGVTKSSTQILKTGYYPRLSYCDMEAVQGYQGNEETMLTYVDVNSLPGGVHFAAIRDTSVSSGSDITYTKTLLNIGEALNAETGVFTAPLEGSYEFSFTALRKNNADISVKINGANHIYFGNSETDGEYDTKAIIFHLTLKKGDQVKLYLNSHTIACDGDEFATFTGRLVSEA